MTPWHAEARRMHELHPEASVAEIAYTFEVSWGAAHDALHVDDRPRCQNAACRQPRGRGSKCRPEGHCADCRAVIRTVRRSLAEGMWAAGWSGDEIADGLGSPKRFESSTYRARGWNLPYRYQMRSAA